MFAGKRRSARQHYEEYVKEGIDIGSRPELIGGGLIRSLGGWSAVKAMLTDVPVEQVVAPDRSRTISQARSLLCFWATRELGMSQTDLAQRLQLTQSAVSQAIQRGRWRALERNCSVESK
jgi:putative transposase